MQVPDLVEACRKYMCNTLNSCEPSWAWVVFTIAQQLDMEDLVKAAAIELTCAALTDNDWVAHASVAIKASDFSAAVQLEGIWGGISKAVHAAKDPSHALLVVLLMRLNQLAGDTGSDTNPDVDSDSLLQPLEDNAIVALLKRVDWDALHHVEINALSSQARSYKATAAADFVKDALLQQVCQRGMKVRSGLVPPDALPPGQPAAQYLAAWVDADSLVPTSSSWVEVPCIGVYGGVKSGSIDITLKVEYKPSSDGFPPGGEFNPQKRSQASAPCFSSW